MASEGDGSKAGAPRRTIRVGGVPEHFNAPWHIAKDQGKFEPTGVDVEWTDYPGGTGDMCKALDKRDVDVAIMLTEGTLVEALKDNNITIVGVYVSSSAIWGVHAGAKSCEADDIEDMKDDVTFAISRYGSGSHLMAYVYAESLGWDTESLKFKVVGGLKGAIEELPKDGTLVFMWEMFTTLPWVVDGTFKRVGTFPTPWPFFSIAANKEFLAEEGAKEALVSVLEVVKGAADDFRVGGQSTFEYILEHYRIEKEPAAEWLPTVNWACQPQVDLEMLHKVGETLHRLKKIETASGNPPTQAEIEAATTQLETSNKRAKTEETSDAAAAEAAVAEVAEAAASVEQPAESDGGADAAARKQADLDKAAEKKAGEEEQ